MESVEHLTISSVVSPVLVAALYGVADPVMFLTLSLYGVMAGVLIDLDHFIWARYNHGHWNHLLDAVEQPFTVMRDNKEIMGEDALDSHQRYASHLFIFALAGSLAYTVSFEFMVLTAGMMIVHILSDVYHTFRKRRA